MTDRLAEMERQVIENLPIKTLEHRNMYSKLLLNFELCQPYVDNF